MFFGLKREEYKHLNKVILSSQNLKYNLRKLKCIPVLKSNAYGHGIINIAKALSLDTPFLCVDSLFEAYQLYKAGIKIPILVMGYIDPESIRVKKLPFRYALFDAGFAEAVKKYQPHAKVHIFIDTGMNREGVKVSGLPVFLEKVKGVAVEGVMSHLSSPENRAKTDKQLREFKKGVRVIAGAGFNPNYIHLGGGGAVYPQGLVRSGLAVYGFKKGLKPVLSLVTKVVQIKRISKGSEVGYGSFFKAKKEMVIGVLPIGYADGVDRRLSNKGLVKVGKKFCKIIGLVSMNITTIDLGGVKNPYIGQEVVVFSANPKDPNSIEEVAKLCKASIYELLIHINPTIKREVI